MDWAKTIREEGQKNSVLQTDQLAQKYGIVPPAVTQALARQEKRGLVERVGEKIYFNLLAPNSSPRDLVNVLRKKAYISLDSALREYGISTQSPRVLTCVTPERSRELRSKTISIKYRNLSPNLYWGFVKKTTRYGSYLIAEPEKAILDWVYLNLKDGTSPALDEFDFSKINKHKLLDYAQKFPSTVYHHLIETFASEGATSLEDPHSRSADTSPAP
jgi:predicted transcriptional regulator of viral defense system